MEGLGARLRARARELGWSDAEVARRVGLSQTRYANYVIDKHEPDLAVFARICSVLGASASDLLHGPARGDDEAAALRRRIRAVADALDAHSLSVAATVLDGLLARSGAAGREPGRGGGGEEHGGDLSTE